MGGRGGQPDNDAGEREEKKKEGHERQKRRKGEEKSHSGYFCKTRRCPGDLAQEMKPPAAGILS